MTIDVKNSPRQNIDVFVENTSQEIDVEQDVIIVKVVEDVPLYEGEYEVTPKVTEQTLSTAQTFLQKDVRVKKIPYFEVTNNSGGMTASIGDI